MSNFLDLSTLVFHFQKRWIRMNEIQAWRIRVKRVNRESEWKNFTKFRNHTVQLVNWNKWSHVPRLRCKRQRASSRMNSKQTRINHALWDFLHASFVPLLLRSNTYRHVSVHVYKKLVKDNSYGIITTRANRSRIAFVKKKPRNFTAFHSRLTFSQISWILLPENVSLTINFSSLICSFACHINWKKNV